MNSTTVLCTHIYKHKEHTVHSEQARKVDLSPGHVLTLLCNFCHGHFRPAATTAIYRLRVNYRHRAQQTQSGKRKNNPADKSHEFWLSRFGPPSPWYH